MNFSLSEEQQMLQASAAAFVKRESPLSRVRALRTDEIGFSRDLWRAMAGLGWLGMSYPEAVGGLGQGAVETIVVMEELGRGLLPEPMLSTVLLGGKALLEAGSEAQRQQWLPALVEGERFLSLGYLERQGRYDPFTVTARAKRDGKASKSWRLSGEKTYSRTIERALEDFVRRARAKQILSLRGSGLWEGDLSVMRSDRPSRKRRSRSK